MQFYVCCAYCYDKINQHIILYKWTLGSKFLYPFILHKTTLPSSALKVVLKNYNASNITNL